MDFELGDLIELGEKIAEMCDRVAKMDPLVPGTKARWVLGLEDRDFLVEISLHQPQQDTSNEAE